MNYPVTNQSVRWLFPSCQVITHTNKLSVATELCVLLNENAKRKAGTVGVSKDTAAYAECGSEG